MRPKLILYDLLAITGVNSHIFYNSFRDSAGCSDSGDTTDVTL